MQERAPRIARSLVVRFRVPGQRSWQASPLRDLSRSGAKFFSEIPLETGAMLELQLRFPGARDGLLVPAKVIWARSRSTPLQLTEIGVAFLSQDPSIQQAIDAAVADELSRRKPSA